MYGLTCLIFHNFCCFFQIADIKEASSIIEKLRSISLWVWNDNFIDLNSVSKDWLNNFCYLEFKIFLAKITFFCDLYLFLWKSCFFKFKHHFWEIFWDNSFGDSNFVSQNNRVVEFFFNITNIIRVLIINKREAFVLSEFAHWQFQTGNWFDFEMFLKHCCC